MDEILEILEENSRYSDEQIAVMAGKTVEEVKERLKNTCIEIMEKEDNQTVLAVSHAGACYHFLRNWHDDEFVTTELKKGFPNCCIFKYEYENKVFNLVEVIRF